MQWNRVALVVSASLLQRKASATAEPLVDVRLGIQQKAHDSRVVQSGVGQRRSPSTIHEPRAGPQAPKQCHLEERGGGREGRRRGGMGGEGGRT